MKKWPGNKYRMLQFRIVVLEGRKIEPLSVVCKRYTEVSKWWPQYAGQPILTRAAGAVSCCGAAPCKTWGVLGQLGYALAGPGFGQLVASVQAAFVKPGHR